MLHTILIIAALAAVVLIVLYMLARRYPLFGDSLAFPLIFVARPLVTLQKMLESAGRYCHGVFEKSLNYPPGVLGDTWHGVSVIARNIQLYISSIIITGDVYGTLQTLPLLFGGAGAVDLPGSFAIPSALLFVSMSALYGAVALECAGLLPYGAHLFPKMSEKVRKWLGIFCGIGFALSLVFAVLFWIFKGWYIASPDDAGVLAIPVLALVGLLITGASVLAFWGLVVGFTGLLSIVFWLLSFAFHAAAGGVSIVPSQLDVFVQHITQGRISVYGELLGHDPYKVPGSPFPASGRALTSQTATAMLPEYAASIDADTDNVQIFPVLTPELEEKMSKHPDCNASLVFVGSYGSKVRPYVLRKLDELFAKGSILSSGYLDLSINHIPTAIPGIVDISPTVAERQAATMHGRTEDEIYTTLFHLLDGRLAETHRHTRAAPGSFTFIVDPYKLVDFANVAESIKHRYPLHSLHVVTSLSEQTAQNPSVHTGMVDMQSLVAEDILETVFLTSPRSSFASAYGEQTQHNFFAQALVSLILGHKHNLSNQTFTSVLQELHRLSPFATFSFASEAVALGSVPSRLKWIPGVSGAAGAHMGDFSDIILQARNVATRVITDPDTRAFDAELSAENPCVVLLNTPIPLSDPRFNEFSRDMALWVGSNFPFASSISVRGNGCAYPYHLGGKFLVQATAIYPLQPASLFPRLQPARPVKVTPLYPVSTAIEPAANNGRVRTSEAHETDTKKPSSSSRKIKATSKRVVRKSKQAQ